MASRSTKIRGHYQDLYGRACRKCKPNPDGSYVEEQVTNALARILLPDIDPDHAAMIKAKMIMATLTRQQGSSEEDDDDASSLQLELFGETYPYNPLRLLKDSRGNIISEEKATLPFILAELARSAEHLSRVATWNTRKARKAKFFQEWCDSEMATGRKSIELTWGNCAKETGIIRPTA